MPKFHWKKKKAIAMYINRRQWQRDYDPDESTAVEIEMEQGGYLVTQASISATPTYITTE